MIGVSTLGNSILRLNSAGMGANICPGGVGLPGGCAFFANGDLACTSNYGTVMRVILNVTCTSSVVISSGYYNQSIGAVFVDQIQSVWVANNKNVMRILSPNDAVPVMNTIAKSDVGIFYLAPDAFGNVYATLANSSEVVRLSPTGWSGPCPTPGQFGSTCSNCPAGSFCPLGTIRPIMCPAGMFCPAGMALLFCV